MMIRRMTCVAMLIVCGVGGVAAADEPGADAFLPAGLNACVQGVQGGQVDWTCGHIIAVGRGKAHGRTDQDKHMARRAAEVVAARNALAIAAGLRIDDEGGFADIENAEVQLRGIIRGHETLSTLWNPKNQPPDCVVQLKVPLWGLESVASVIYANQHQKTFQSRRPRLVLAPAQDALANEVVVIDARGLGVRPCLFPIVSQTGGAVLYDVCTVSGEASASILPPVRYAESDLSHVALVNTAMSRERLTQRAGLPHAGPNHDLSTHMISMPARHYLRLAQPSTRVADDTQKHLSTQPTTKPSKKVRRRRVVKAVKAAGTNKTEIVLTKEDAEKLRKDPKGAALLRAGRVVVVVDSVAAGIEGRKNNQPGDMELALFHR